MTDLTDFLLARIAEDEAVAEEAAREGYEHWRQGRDGESRKAVFYDGLNGRVVQGDVSTWPAEAAHIARWDPARVLDECMWKQSIVHAWRTATAPNASGLHYAMRQIALMYSDHPDYDPAWRP